MGYGLKEINNFYLFFPIFLPVLYHSRYSLTNLIFVLPGSARDNLSIIFLHFILYIAEIQFITILILCSGRIVKEEAGDIGKNPLTSLVELKSQYLKVKSNSCYVRFIIKRKRKWRMLL